MNNKMTTRNLTEGALMAGLSAILVLAGSFLPLIGALLLLVCGLPITIVTVRNGSYLGGLSAMVVVCLLAIIVGPLSAISCGLQFILIAWIFGWMFAHRKSAGKTICAGVAASLVATILLALMSFALMGFSVESLQTQMYAYMDDAIGMYESMGLLEQMAVRQGVTTVEFEEQMMQNMTAILGLLPSILLFSSAFTALINYGITIYILKRLKIKIPRMKPFKQFSLPNGTIWVVILIWALWLGRSHLNIGVIPIILQNLFLLGCALLFLQGLAVTAYWFDISSMSLGMKIFTGFFVFFFFTGFLVSCVFMGLGDLLFDLRKLRKSEK